MFCPKTVFIIMGFPSGNRSQLKVLKDSFTKKETAIGYLKSIGCVYERNFWRKDGMLYDIAELNVKKR